ncbi:MAG: lipoprotein [Pseudomonadota bacterium]
MKLSVPILLAAFALSACGLRGGLERPAPLFGDPNAAPPELQLNEEVTPVFDEDEEEETIEDAPPPGQPIAAPVAKVEEEPLDEPKSR